MAFARGVVWRESRWESRPDGPADAPATDIAELLGPDLAQWHSLRARSPDAAARRLAGRAAVRDLVVELDLFAWRGYEPTKWGGKPTFVGARHDFSIAHTADRMLIGIAERGRIGVDIEGVGDGFDSAGLQRRMCTPAELARTGALDPADRREWLARLWTAKEAIAKVDGQGLRYDFRSMIVPPSISSPPIEDGFVAAIATRSEDPSSEIELWHPELSRSKASSAR